MTTLSLKGGAAKLNTKIILQDILYVPSLNCNLISISQFINDIFCTIIFTNKFCNIQDPNMRILIRVDETRRAVYFYKDTIATEIQTNKVISYDLWHCRLGHPFSQKLSNYLSNIQRDFINKNDLCNVCLHA